jgi:hypothetical protein
MIRRKKVVKKKKVIEPFIPVISITKAVPMGPTCQVEGCVNPLAPGQNQVCRDHIKAN